MEAKDSREVLSEARENVKLTSCENWRAQGFKIHVKFLIKIDFESGTDRAMNKGTLDQRSSFELFVKRPDCQALPWKQPN